MFTPRWLVDEMLDLVAAEAERIDSRFLEPACGSGNFLVAVLERKLATVRARYGRSAFELRHQALVALMSLYGIELLPDNAAECRANLLDVFTGFLKSKAGDSWTRAGRAVLEANVVQGDALRMVTHDAKMIVFPEWAYLGRGRFQRRDFSYASLTQRSGPDGPHGGDPGHGIFTPVRDWPPLTVADLAGMA